MINEYIRYKLPTSRSDAFVAAYTAAAESLRASPHCLGYELSVCSEDPESFILKIQWDSAEGHIDGFRKSTVFPAFLAQIKAFMPEIEEMRHYTITELRWSRPGE